MSTSPTSSSRQNPLTTRDYWIGVSQNVVAWGIVIAAVLVIERALAGRRVPALHV